MGLAKAVVMLLFKVSHFTDIISTCVSDEGEYIVNYMFSKQLLAGALNLVDIAQHAQFQRTLQYCTW